VTSNLKRITVLGSTGSIGCSTLDVIAAHASRFGVYALSANSRMAELAAQCARFSAEVAVVPNAARADELAVLLRELGCTTQIAYGPAALEQIASHASVDMVMCAIVGAAGLAPTLASARAGKRVLLANKEALVVGGDFMLDAVRKYGAELLPIDSEHSAIFQSLPADRKRWPLDVHRIILTASGGPFLKTPIAQIASMSPKQAVAHPNWSMGQKISVDSASMMNKALEVIEAHYLFGFAPEQIDVLIHPQSIVHSMVEMKDGAVMAQLGTPDMKMPIALGLSYPERIETHAPRLDFLNLKPLEFFALEDARFPSLKLAYQALAGQRGACAVLNAANEVAVELFLAEKIQFGEIAALNLAVLQGMNWTSPQSVEALISLDEETRAFTRQRAQRLQAA
jgi:1-deoxy-D-xylulose-5-phosphate reductoisomerase